MPNTAQCDCLTAEDATLPHATRCATVQADRGRTFPVDHDDIRELAELAAYRDIDTALHILRNHRARSAR